jgi:hypothetical protein
MAKLSKNIEVVDKINMEVIQTKEEKKAKSKINGTIALDNAQQLRQLHDVMHNYVNDSKSNYDKAVFANYATEYLSLLQTYSNFYEKLFIKANNLVYSDNEVPVSATESSYINKISFKSKIYQKLIKPKVQGELFIFDFLDSKNEHLVDELYLQQVLQKYALSKTDINDIIFIIFMFIIIRYSTDITSSELSIYIPEENAFVLSYFENNINQTMLDSKAINAIKKCVIKNIVVINKVITEHIPPAFLQEIIID